MIKYIIYSIIVLFILIFLYVKMKFKFWSKQPVFHVYKLNYWLFPPGIINTKLPEKTVYFNPSIKIKKYSEISITLKIYYML